MGWFTDTLNALDKPSNALQGYFVGGMRDDETRFEGMKRGWNQEENYDFEQLWDEDLQKKGWSEREGVSEKSSYIASTLANLVVDPLNAVPIGSIFKGMGMMRAGSKAGANVEKGAMKGSVISGIPNYIDEFYGPSVPTTAQADKMLAGKTFDSPILMSVNDALSQPISVTTYKGAQWAKGVAGTMAVGAKNAVKTTLSPENRALWRGDKINKEGMLAKPISPKGNEDLEYVHRALFQAHIAKGTGSVGERQLSEQLLIKLGNRGYVPFDKGSYADMSEGFHSVLRGADGPATREELTAMEDIIGNVWKDKGVAIKDDNAQFFIKNDSSPKGGAHINDLKMLLGRKGGELDVVQKAFDNPEVDNMSLEELAEYLGKQTYTRPKNEGIGKFGKNLFSKQWWRDKVNAPLEEYKPSIEIKEGNVFMNFSMAGSSITEGGVNVVAGFQPSGRMVTAVSDEHNFLEKFIPSKVNKYMLPNRIVMITTPVIGNIKTFSLKASKRTAEPDIRGIGYNIGKEKRVKDIMEDNPVAKLNNFKTMIKEMQTAKPKPADLLYEQGRQLQGYGNVGLGLFALPNTND